MHLLRPYPEEVVGSMIHRACRETGIPLKRLLPSVTGAKISNQSFVMTNHVMVSETFGMSMQTLLFLHTLFPYSICFMDPAQKEKVSRTVLSGPQPGRSLATLSKNAIQGTSQLRLCPRCCRDDLRDFGLSYWHRHHQLPCTYVCLKHMCMLRSSTFSVRPGTCVPEPAAAPRQKIRTPKEIPFEVICRIAEVSAFACNDRSLRLPQVKQAYRQRARDLGYGISSTQLLGSAISADLASFYGLEFLHSVGCDIPANSRPWPALLLRPAAENCPPLKHVLLTVFLERAAKSVRTPTAHMKGPKLRDWKTVEDAAIRTMTDQLAKHRAEGKRTAVADLLKHTGMLSQYKHNKVMFPRLVAWLKAFKASADSIRQTGRRPRIR